MNYQTKADLIHALRQAGAFLIANQLTWGKAGNLSARLNSDTLLVTASGTNLGALRGEDFVEVPIAATGEQNFSRRPTKELPMHRAVYAARSDVQAVVHASPFYTTLIACSGVDVPAGMFVEAMYYLERVARVPYAHPGAMRLGEWVGEKAAQANLLLLENHGVLAYDTSLDEALMGVQAFELAAKTWVAARSAGIDLNLIPSEVMQDFLVNSGYRPRRSWPE